MTYVEVFAGGASVLLNKDPSQREVWNDLDYKMYCLFEVLKDDVWAMRDALREWGYSRETFEYTKKVAPSLTTPFGIGVAEYILRRQSQGGRKKAFAWSERLRGGEPGDLHAWNTAIDTLLPLISRRLRNVEISNLSFEQIIPQYDNEDTLFYLDPPYVKSTRYSGAREVYDHEMTDSQHNQLLDLCLSTKAKVILSGYHSELYANRLKDWHCKVKTIANHSSHKKNKTQKKEYLWANYDL